jgi:hypothetical protein
MKKEIKNYNSKGEPHGYQQSFHVNKLLFRATYKNMKYLGYREWHGMKQTEFYIS